ncbi:putative baseplate assembly protein [Corallococcus exercitus]|uniref:Putative baseplate assembly protein n=1 Tax=Corallococcus exercitus TaxID=2316736 RepID=A0A7Y4NRE3_9BACT|nr:putative baseplate assembly protein [Corallococcus exercitus]NOK34655.1 putative baseplate assembly protein [Corallococcus exercitus]
MGTSYARGSEIRRKQVRASQQPLNGIDFLELLPGTTAADPGAYLLVYMLKPDGLSAMEPGLVAIRGGARLTSIPVQWTAVASDLLPAAEAPARWQQLGWTRPQAEALSTYFQRREQYDPGDPAASSTPARVLVVRTWSRGDLSTYTLSLTSPPSVLFDRQLQSLDFSFQVYESEFDCGTPAPAVRAPAEEPEVDYLAKDFASFRRLMLDRMSTLLPDWRERNPADLGVTLVETLAAAGDFLSYYQDAVATDAYLGTSRQRISVRRHARLLDFLMHDGCNARTFVVLEVGSGEGEPPLNLLPGPDVAVRFLTGVDTLPVASREDLVDPQLAAQAETFEPLHDVLLRKERNLIPFYTWGEPMARLPVGATRATLRNKGGHRPDGGLKLAVGDLLLLEEVRGPEDGDEAEARPERRQVVRLTAVTYTADPLYDEDSGQPYTDAAPNPNPLQVADVGWSDTDALTFELCIGTVPAVDGAGPLPLSVARGNVVVVDHGRTVLPREIFEVGRDVELSAPRLRQAPLTQQGRVRNQRGVLVPLDPVAPASHALEWEMRDVQPSVLLYEQPSGALGGTSLVQQAWSPRRDLLGSDRFASEFVVEVDDQERATLRFGDDLKGRRPLSGTRFSAHYRVGSGSRGNISAGALRHVMFTPLSASGSASAAVHTSTTGGILRVRNPLPAVGGRDPQSTDEVRLLAPTAFRTQERAVTEANYAELAERHPEVRKAAAVFRWTGSWHTVFVFVDRAGGLPVDEPFRARLGAFLERYRMTRHDVRIESPRHVPLDIALTVHIASDYLRSTVRKGLLESFSNTVLADGTRGFFHPDRWTFGQAVLLSQLIATAMAVPGVGWVDFTDNSGEFPTPARARRFRRWGEPPAGELNQGFISIGPLEIARLDNDAGRPENGRIEFYMEGGL